MTNTASEKRAAANGIRVISSRAWASAVRPWPLCTRRRKHNDRAQKCSSSIITDLNLIIITIWQLYVYIFFNQVLKLCYNGFWNSNEPSSSRRMRLARSGVISVFLFELRSRHALIKFLRLRAVHFTKVPIDEGGEGRQISPK
jgi:hypothetical protein